MKAKMILRTVVAAALLVCLSALPFAAQASKPAPLGKQVVDHLKYPKLNPIKAPAVARETLPNGIKLILIEDHELPVISMRALVKGGKLAQPQDKPALAELFGEVQRTGGVKSMSGDEMDTFLERIGASIETSVRDDYGTVTAKTLT
ncbi:MAG: insulinase family protein, partial [Acidobacteria bacterium]|nr:insulinase family protein [Acidobacteriota bacterium]